MIREIHPSRFEIDTLPDVWFRSREQAKRSVGLTVAEAWTLVLSDSTLAKDTRLMIYVCRAKVSNDLPLTPSERAYLDRLQQLTAALRNLGVNLGHTDRDDVDALDRLLWAHYGIQSGC